MEERVSFYKEGQSLIAGINCDLDHHAAKGVREAIDKKIFENQPRVLGTQMGDKVQGVMEQGAHETAGGTHDQAEDAPSEHGFCKLAGFL